MTMTKKLMTAAIAVAAVATVSVASQQRRFGPRRARRRGFPRRIPWWRRQVLWWRPALRPPLARAPSLARPPFLPLWRLWLCLQHLLEVHALRPRERVPRRCRTNCHDAVLTTRPGEWLGRVSHLLGPRGSQPSAMRYPVTPHSRGDPGPHGKVTPAPDTILSVLPAELSAALFASARPHRLKADQMLFAAGDPGDGCYRVEQGLLKVTVVSPSGSERILAILGPGTLVGELAMIDARPRSASVTAARDSELSFISRTSFEAVAERNPEVFRPIPTCWRGACATPTTWSPR